MTVGIEVWADIVCPWCFIGKRRLQLAQVAAGIYTSVRHRAFQLDPSAVNQGRRVVDVLAEKYRVSTAQAEEMMDNVTEVAASVGLTYRMDECLSGNTKDAHRLLLWAQEHGDAQTLVENLYTAYFTEGRPVFTVDELIPIAADSGFDAGQARAVLATTSYADDVAADQRLAGELGATGVPFFVLEGRLGIAGAQPQEVFEQALRQVSQNT